MCGDHPVGNIAISKMVKVVIIFGGTPKCRCPSRIEMYTHSKLPEKDGKERFNIYI